MRLVYLAFVINQLVVNKYFDNITNLFVGSLEFSRLLRQNGIICKEDCWTPHCLIPKSESRVYVLSFCVFVCVFLWYTVMQYFEN